MTKILVAEDDRVNRECMRVLLERLGLHVYTVLRGEDALAALANEKFDLVLMDIRLRGMDGVEATRRIRSSASDYALIPILAVTALAMNGDRERILAAGFDGYLAKPFLSQDLITFVSSYLTVPWRSGPGRITKIEP